MKLAPGRIPVLGLQVRHTALVHFNLGADLAEQAFRPARRPAEGWDTA
jgi:hypothetical protein